MRLSLPPSLEVGAAAAGAGVVLANKISEGIMKLLIISGTPKTDGVTYSFVETAEKMAKQLGAEAEVLRLSGLKLSKCKMCDDGWGVCFKDHYCIFGEKDGFNELLKKVDAADAYIYITPVYWGEVSEEMKIFIDKLRRCEATKQWDSRDEQVSFHKGKPSIAVAVAGGGGGGIISAFADFERAISQMSGDEWPRESSGMFDWIAVNRWNQTYKREALSAAIKAMVNHKRHPKIVDVSTRDDYELLLVFDNGEKRIFDVKPYLGRKPHSELKDLELFKQAKVSGFKIEWRPRLDIDTYAMYEESKAL